MDADYLDYFRKLVEGESEIIFPRYFRVNEASLEAAFKRAQFLRLKFSPAQEIQTILQAANIAYAPNQSAIRNITYTINFDANLLDENGALLQDHKNQLFSGAIKFFEAGDHAAARHALLAHIETFRDLDRETALENFADIEHLAFLELKFGDVNLGLFLCQILADMPHEQNHVDDVSIRARETLDNYHQPQTPNI